MAPLTEAEWLACTDPAPMLEFLLASGRASQRKLRLFATASCRLAWALLQDSRLRRAVETSERYADRLAGKEELLAAWWAAHEALGVLGRALAAVSGGRDFPVSKTGEGADGGVSWLGSCGDAANGVVGGTSVDAAHAARAVVARLHWRDLFMGSLLRDVFGTPFRPVQLDPAWLAWRGGAIRNLAGAVYEERDLPSGHLDLIRLAVLADMLEEASCTDADLLAHLRGPGPHVRGCWVVDLVSGRQ
jgi:hypothetical protein